MIVDDEPDIAEALLPKLRAAGYLPIFCGNGVAAFDRLRGEGADLAVLDVNMPVMDGLELCRRIRRDPLLRGLPIILLTVRGGAHEQVKGFESGADDYIPKPYDASVLIARLRALERRALQTATKH